MTKAEPDTGTTDQGDTPTDQPDKGAPQEPDKGEQTAEVEKWKALAQKHEARARANAEAAKRLEALERESMDETDKAVAQARAEERDRVRREYASRLVDSELRAAAAGRPVDADALLDGVDRAHFVTDELEPDREAIVAWLDRVAPVPPPPPEGDERPSQPVPMLDLGQGARSVVPLNGDPLERMLKQSLGIR
jgi:hypothetical protein